MTRLLTALVVTLGVASTLSALVLALALPGVAGTLATVEKTEPTSLLLLGSALAAIGLLVRRKLRRVGGQSSG